MTTQRIRLFAVAGLIALGTPQCASPGPENQDGVGDGDGDGGTTTSGTTSSSGKGGTPASTGGTNSTGGTDPATGGTDMSPGGAAGAADCANYCTVWFSAGCNDHVTDDYTDQGDCVTRCEDFTTDVTRCREGHVISASMGGADSHCGHAAETPTSICSP